MRDRASETIKTPNDYGIETPPVGVSHEFVEFGSAVFSARDTLVDVLASEPPSSSITVLAKLAGLHRRVLAVVCGGDSRVERNTGRARLRLFFL
ncbi:MAG: hypothetical protein WA020_02350 [Candidatus Acidiferrales bacterium]